MLALETLLCVVLVGGSVMLALETLLCVALIVLVGGKIMVALQNSNLDWPPK